MLSLEIQVLSMFPFCCAQYWLPPKTDSESTTTIPDTKYIWAGNHAGKQEIPSWESLAMTSLLSCLSESGHKLILQQVIGKKIEVIARIGTWSPPESQLNS
jgi:hypothetical protein